jgi:ribosomal protein S18 acetylase RimI-like enzyme
VTQPWRLRAASPGDAPVLAAILVRTWRQRYPGLVAPAVLDALDEQGFAEWFARVLDPSTGHHATLATVDGAHAGFIHFGPEEQEPGRGHVFSFYVAPPYSGRGVGRDLLAHALSELSAEGYDVVTLWAFRDNAPTMRLYTRAGFRPDGGERVEDEFGVPELRLRLQLGASTAWQRLTR